MTIKLGATEISALPGYSKVYLGATEIWTSGAIDELLQALQNANSTMCLIGSRADGTNPGTNAPFSTTLVDIVGSNNATLTNFAGTPASGWDGVTVPSGTEQMLKADGVDDCGVIANSPSLDPTGTEDFAFACTMKTNGTLETTYLYFKGLDSDVNSQIAIRPLSNGSMFIYLAGTLFNITGVHFSVNTMHFVTVKRISGRLKVIVNDIEVYNQPNTASLSTQPHIRFFARTSNVGGTSHTFYGSYHLGALAFFYNGATGLNEANVDTACALLRAPYF